MGFSIELVDGIVQANNNTFKLVRGKDIDFTQATNVNYTALASGDLILLRDIDADVSTNTNADIKSTSLNNFAVFMVTHIGSGNGGFVPPAGTSGHFLAHNGAFAQVDYNSLSNTPTIPSITNATDNRVLTSTGGTGINAESGLTFNAGHLDLEASVAQITVHRTGNDGNAPFMTFLKDRGGAGADNDDIAKFNFSSFDDDSTPNQTIYAMIVASISDATESEESGNLALSVTNHGTGDQVGLLLKGDTNVANTVDVDIAKGTSSTTTVAGDLTVTSGITLGGHKVNDIDINSEHVDSDEHLMTSKAIKNYVATNGGSVTVSDNNTDDNFPVVFHDESNNLHDDTGTFEYNPSEQNLTVGTNTNATISTSGSMQAFNYYAIDNTNASTGPIFDFRKTRGGSTASQNNDISGQIKFTNKNDASSPEPIIFADILSTIANVTDGDERGKLELKVANDGVLRNGITMIGSDTAEEVDVTIGNGSDSLTTVAGDLTVTGDIVSSKITTSAEQSVLAGNLSIGAHDDQDRIYLARYASGYPEAHIFCGLAANNVTTGFQVVTKNGSSYQEAFTINGSNRTATFQGNISGLAQLTVANNINANGDIVGDNNTDITGISGITAATGSFTTEITSVRQVANNSEAVIRSSRVGTTAGKIGGLCEMISEGAVSGGGNTVAGRVYKLTDSNPTSGTPT